MNLELPTSTATTPFLLLAAGVALVLLFTAAVIATETTEKSFTNPPRLAKILPKLLIFAQIGTVMATLVLATVWAVGNPEKEQAQQDLAAEAERVYGITLGETATASLLAGARNLPTEETTAIYRFGTVELTAGTSLTEIQLILDGNEWVLIDLGSTSLQELPRR